MVSSIDLSQFLAPGTSPAKVASLERAVIRLQKRELTDLGQTLAALRTHLKEFERIGLEPVSSADDRLKDEAKIRTLLTAIGKSLDEVFNPEFEILSPTLLESVQDELKEAITDAFKLILSTTKDINFLRSRMGIDIDFTDPTEGVFKFDPPQFLRSFENDLTNLKKFLFFDPKGLIGGLIQKLDELGTTPLEELDPDASTGFLIELQA